VPYYNPYEVADEDVVRQQSLLSDEDAIECNEEDEEEYAEEESDFTIVELENRAQGPDINVVVVGQARSGKSQLVSSIVGRHAQPWAGAPAQLSGEKWWTPYKTHPRSKITWWDSKGIDSWSNNGSLRMIEAMDELEAASFNVDFVVITINEQHLVRAAYSYLRLLHCVWSSECKVQCCGGQVGAVVAPLLKFLEELNSLGKHVAIVVVNEGRCSPEGLRARPVLSAVLAQLGGASPISDNLTQAKMDNGGTISLFATSSDVGTSDGSVSKFHLQELLLCIFDALPHDRRTSRSISALHGFH
jgi:hypothetical protein